MKKFLTILSLVLALSLCAGALAEETAPAAPTEVETVTEQTATEQAIDAYRALKGSARVKNLDALKAELDAYIVDEKLTQDPAGFSRWVQGDQHSGSLPAILFPPVGQNTFYMSNEP